MLSSEGTARLMAFADAVVAIAITLLVLPLVDIPQEAASTPLLEVWQAHQAEFYMFLLSFVVIARLWFSHHSLGERVGRGDPVLVVMTLGWLLTVVFFPLPTEMMGELGNERGVSAVYIATLGVNVALIAVMARYLYQRPALWREGWTRRQMDVWIVGWWSNPLLAVLALVLCLTVPGLGIWSLMVLFLDAVITRILMKRSGLSAVDEEAPADGPAAGRSAD